MALVVFLRGVNVGGHRTFQPSVLARELGDLDVVNIGAAGTFVVRRHISQAALRSELARVLPFEAELMICPAREVLELAADDPFAGARVPANARRTVSVLSTRPRRPPTLPIKQPASARWEVQVVHLRGRFVLSLWRRLGERIIYPNAVVEKHLGLPATTRNWNTIEAICDVLNKE